MRLIFDHKLTFCRNWNFDLMRGEIIIHPRVILAFCAKCLTITFKSSNTNHPTRFAIHETMTLQWLNNAGSDVLLNFTNQQRSTQFRGNWPGGSHRDRWTSSWSAASQRWILCVVATVWPECCCSAALDPSAEPPSPLSGMAGCCGVLRSAVKPTHTWRRADKHRTAI